MNSLMLLWTKVAHELATWCCTSATRDCKTVSCRIEHEGLSFLTITLPQFGSDFQKSLDQSKVDRNLFTGFGWQAGLPRFLGGFLDLVFDRDSGRLLDEPSIDAIFAVRQLTLMFGKIALPCSDARERATIDRFIQCEKDVKEHDSLLSKSDLSDFKRVSRLLFSRVFTAMDRDVYNLENVSPKHGPGSTADGLRGNAKFNQFQWTQRLESILPMGEGFLIPNFSFYERLENIDVLEPGAEIPIKVITVPKTLKTPRIIGVEPTAMQYAQQAILPVILRHLSSNDTLDVMLGFDDQLPNQHMALKGSLSGDLATLDLSDASDRVSNQLVRLMLHDHPHLHEAVDASRSRKADVPGHGVIRLAKFAPMGSALCFPFEAMAFLVMVFIGIERELNRPLCYKDVKRLCSEVRIFGDDIIVPKDYVLSVVNALSTFGSRVNVGKSFWTGKFRESCGKEYFNGHDVSICRVRQVFPPLRRRVPGAVTGPLAKQIVSIVSLRNQLYFRGLWQTCSWLDDEIREVIRHFPMVLPSSPVQGRHSFLGFFSELDCPNLHKPLVKGYIVVANPPRDSLDGVGALLKFLLKRGGLPSVDSRHLERAGRPHAVDIKLRIASAI